ncbi:hypothetical protein [Paramagnetospirillum magneticum]|uniref:Fe2OG dioxygenase domain-containing protein n=1 Tax=Paramagnetospirillum magneticum (strain ATCC 700264 / AMB-1) TaxID=342108 RepID=Q2W620_PARM1|nr:hypothetical protein [Paramagnetospirillum magneticum]BAE50705.1 hypothetical protein amb1901 [Paramagnetospirillum magneticum AMB-1]
MEVTRLPLLSDQACLDWSCRVLLLRRHWTRRHPVVPFFTLGRAAYLDRNKGSHDSQDANRLLRRHFGDLLEAARAGLARHLGQPTELVDTQAALPGFHIYQPHPAFGLPVASLHCDLQHRDAFPQYLDPVPPLLTFTLPISLPPEAGLTVMEGEDARFLPYREGEMVIHDGQSPHRAVLACTGMCDERITLQGHGLFVDHRWLLYW